MGFFKKSGNGGGLFPDVSIETEKSLFTNDDEKDASCPCAIEDNPNSPTTPTSCEPADPVLIPVEEPGDVTPGPVWKSEACVIGFMDKLTWIDDSGEVNVFNQSLDSLIINGFEYVVPGNEPTWEEDKQYPNGLDALTTVPANNLFFRTYLEQVDGMNAAFTALGVDELVKVQVVTNDFWAGTARPAITPFIRDQQGGYYLILGEDVSTISFELNDDGGYVRGYFRDALGVWTVSNSEFGPPDYPPNTVNQLNYEFVTCTDTELNEPFAVTDGVVIEPTW